MSTDTEKIDSPTPPAPEKKPEAAAPSAPLTDFNFPTHGVTIAATSREEAEQKLAAQLKSKQP